MANWQVISLDTTTPQLRAPGTGDGYSFNSGSTQLGVWTTTGLGIGTASPGYKLDVAGNARILNSGADSQLLIVAPTDSYAPAVRWAVSGIRDSGILGFPPADDALVYRSGANSFSTGTERFRITASGNLGIGTASPLTRLHSVSTSAGGQAIALRLENTSATAGTETILQFAANNTSSTARGAQISGLLTGTNGTELLFYTNPTGSAPAERARITSAGELLVGTTSISPTTGGVVLYVDSTRGIVRAGTSTTSADAVAEWYNPNGKVGQIVTSGSSTSYNTSSDQRLKENIVDAPSASDDIDAIQVRSFDWKADGSHQRYGMVAQELVTVAPEAVHQPEDPEQMMGVDYSKLVPMLVKEVQSLRKRVAELEAK